MDNANTRVCTTDWKRGPIVVADDDAAMRELIAGMLRRNGYEVLEAEDGDQLLNILATELDDGPVRRPGLVISDVRMPGTSGLEVLRSLHEQVPSVPVVLMTAFDDPAVRDQAERFGAELVLEKPLDLSDLRTVAHALLGP